MYPYIAQAMMGPDAGANKEYHDEPTYQRHDPEYDCGNRPRHDPIARLDWRFLGDLVLTPKRLHSCLYN